MILCIVLFTYCCKTYLIWLEGSSEDVKRCEVSNLYRFWKVHRTYIVSQYRIYSFQCVTKWIYIYCLNFEIKRNEILLQAQLLPGCQKRCNIFCSTSINYNHDIYLKKYSITMWVYYFYIVIFVTNLTEAASFSMYTQQKWNIYYFKTLLIVLHV